MAFTPTRGQLLSSEEQAQGGFTPTNGTPTSDEGGSVLDRIPEQKSPGIFTQIVQGIANPFLRTATNAINFVEGTARLVGGDVQGAKRASTKTRDFGFLGEARPIGVKEDGEFMGTGEFARDVIGTGAEVGSTVVGGGAAATAGKATLKGLALQGAKIAAKEGAVSGALAGFGGAIKDTEKGVGEVVGSTIKGGVAGGVLGGATGGLGPVLSTGLRGLYNTIKPSAKVLLTSAIKPASKLGASLDDAIGQMKTKWDDVLDTSLPDIAATITKNKAIGAGITEIKGTRDLLATTRQAKGAVWAEVKELMGPHSKLEINGDKIADEIMGGITVRMRKEGKGADVLENMANTYRGKLSVEDAENILEEVNQDLIGYYSKSPKSKYAAETDPQLIADIRLAKALREQIDGTLSKVTGQSVNAIKKRYGALRELQEQLEARVLVAERQQMSNIPEQIQMVEGPIGAVSELAQGRPISALGQLARPAIAKAIREFDATDTKIERAFKMILDGGKKPKNIPGLGPLKGQSGLVPDSRIPPAVQKEIDEFVRATGLSPDDAAIEELAIQRAVLHGDEIIAKNAEKRGKIVNADDFRPYFIEDGYNGSNAAAVQEPASYLAKKAFANGLKNPEPLVAFTSGMSGAGKTSALKNNAAYQKVAENSATILDSNLSSLKSAQSKIAQVVQAGKRPEIFYIYRDPVDGFVNGVVKRMLTNEAEMGRIVPAKIVANNAIGSWEVAKKLAEQGFNVRFIDNSLGDKLAAEVPLETLLAKVSYPSEEKLASIFRDEAKKLLDEGTISQEQYSKFIE